MRGGLVGRMGGYPTAENVHHPRPYRRRRHRGWSAVSSSLEPSPPTGHYCLVPYSVTNCFIKLKSHNPHCTASRRPCAPTLPSTYPLWVPFASRPLVYTRPHATSDRMRPPCLRRRRPPRLSLSITLENFLEPLFSDLIKTRLDRVAEIKNNRRREQDKVI